MNLPEIRLYKAVIAFKALSLVGLSCGTIPIVTTTHTKPIIASIRQSVRAEIRYSELKELLLTRTFPKKICIL